MSGYRVAYRKCQSLSLNMSKIFPMALITLDFLAAIVYFSQGDIKRGIYWLSAMSLTICVTV